MPGALVETEMTSESITSTVSDQNGSGSNVERGKRGSGDIGCPGENDKAPGEETMTVSGNRRKYRKVNLGSIPVLSLRVCPVL